MLHDKLAMFELVIGELDMILGHMSSDVDSEARVFDLWSTASDDEAARAGFAALADEVTHARDAYQKTRAVDDAIFGRDFEAA